MDEPFDKKSFLIYKHEYNSVSYLSNEDLGLLFRTICEYENDKTGYFEIYPRIQQAFQFFKMLHGRKLNLNNFNGCSNSNRIGCNSYLVIL